MDLQSTPFSHLDIPPLKVESYKTYRNAAYAKKKIWENAATAQKNVLLSGLLTTLGNPRGNSLVIVHLTPNVAEKLGGVDVVFLEETPIATAAIHELQRHLATELGARFWEDAW